MNSSVAQQLVWLKLLLRCTSLEYSTEQTVGHRTIGRQNKQAVLQGPTLDPPFSERWDKSHRSCLWGWPQEESADWFLMQITKGRERGGGSWEDGGSFAQTEQCFCRLGVGKTVRLRKQQNKSTVKVTSGPSLVDVNLCAGNRGDARLMWLTISRDKSLRCTAVSMCLACLKVRSLWPRHRRRWENAGIPMRVETHLWGKRKSRPVRSWCVVALLSRNYPLKILFKALNKKKCGTSVRVAKKAYPSNRASLLEMLTPPGRIYQLHLPQLNELQAKIGERIRYSLLRLNACKCKLYFCVPRRWCIV